MCFRSCVEGVVKIEAIHQSELLKAGETHAIVVRATSFDLPCKIDLNVSCELLDLTQRDLYEKSVTAYKQKEEEIKHFFTISEKGTEYAVITKPTCFK